MSELVSLIGLQKKQLDQLKAELEQEKALKETYLACYKAKHEDIEGKLFKLSKTLTEIKEIAEKCCIMQAILDCENYDDCTQCGRTSDGEGIQQILQKISECEVNDE